MTLNHLVESLVPDRAEEARRNRKAVLWRCWHGQTFIGYRVAGLHGENARAFVGPGAWDEAAAEWAVRGRGVRRR